MLGVLLMTVLFFIVLMISVFAIMALVVKTVTFILESVYRVNDKINNFRG